MQHCGNMPIIITPRVHTNTHTILCDHVRSILLHTYYHPPSIPDGSQQICAHVFWLIARAAGQRAYNVAAARHEKNELVAVSRALLSHKTRTHRGGACRLIRMFYVVRKLVVVVVVVHARRANINRCVCVYARSCVRACVRLMPMSWSLYHVCARVCWFRVH